MKLSWKVLTFMFLLFISAKHLSIAQQDSDDNDDGLLPNEEKCNGIFLSYNFLSRRKEFPYLKNASAQSWAFNSTVKVLNTGIYQLQGWKVFIGFQYEEILVSATGAILTDGDDLPAAVGNGTYLSGYPQADLKTSIETAGDLSQIQVQIALSGTQFGLKPPGIPLPRTIQLVDAGYKCPTPTRAKTVMHACCVRTPKIKDKSNLRNKFLPRQKGDLLFSYDITQASVNNYMALVTMENANPLGRLDHWNLTWEWMRGEFIMSLKGAFVRIVDISECIYGPAGQYYGDMDFSKVQSCQKKPIISDLPAERANDTQVGKIPHCCRNGSLLPELMDGSKSKAAFQVQVFKIPPDMNRTNLYPPENWKVIGDLNPDYKCGAPRRVNPTEFPDPSGLQSVTLAIASWQVVCNITRPEKRKSRCCVSFSAYYNESVVPCNTCACGCENTHECNPNAPAMLLPPETLLVPFVNRSEKAIAWANLKHFHAPHPLPCGDNCGVSINWHVSSDYKSGWSARITLFNWEEMNFEDWFTAIQLKKAGVGYEKAYSFNATLLKQLNNTIFLQGLPGLNYLVGEKNGKDPNRDPRVPGKQQTVISFTKKRIRGINIPQGDGFPSRVLFNGEECELPTRIPIGSGSRYHVNLMQVVILVVTFFLMENQN